MTPEDLANLHARAFTMPRPWSADEFASLLNSPHVFVAGNNQGFVMGRVIAGEAELLTIAVDPDHRRKGLGHTTLLSEFLKLALERAADTAFLEVAADNAAALALYLSHGFTEAGRRPGYYIPPSGPTIDALVMKKALQPYLP